MCFSSACQRQLNERLLQRFSLGESLISCMCAIYTASHRRSESAITKAVKEPRGVLRTFFCQRKMCRLLLDELLWCFARHVDDTEKHWFCCVIQSSEPTLVSFIRVQARKEIWAAKSFLILPKISDLGRKSQSLKGFCGLGRKQNKLGDLEQLVSMVSKGCFQISTFILLFETLFFTLNSKRPSSVDVQAKHKKK